MLEINSLLPLKCKRTLRKARLGTGKRGALILDTRSELETPFFSSRPVTRERDVLEGGGKSSPFSASDFQPPETPHNSRQEKESPRGKGRSVGGGIGGKGGDVLAGMGFPKAAKVL